MSSVIQLRKRGVFTLPKPLREKYDLGEGDALQLVDVDGVFVLTPMAPMVPKLAREIQRLREQQGLSPDTLIQQLRDIRAQQTRATYGEEPSDA